jgi:hypothetical protein
MDDAMKVKEAKEIVQQWVLAEGSHMPGFRCAVYHGSINWLADDDALPTTSDVDIMLVLEGSNLPDKPGTFKFRGVTIQASYLPLDQVQSPEQVLAVSHLAGSFRAASVILDLTGWLTALTEVVSRNYAKRRWVYRRCEHAREKVLAHLQGLAAPEPFHEQVPHWLFGAGVTTHILLVAGLKNPTVRRRYLAVRELLADYGRSDFYDTLLGMLGCENMSKARAEHHLASMSEAFDAAKSVIKTPFSFAGEISDVARPLAIDGSRDLIERGYHREAVFWIVATYSRCQAVLYRDAPAELHNRFTPGYTELLAGLGIASLGDLQRRSDEVRSLLPAVWDVAEEIIAANPEIED